MSRTSPRLDLPLKIRILFAARSFINRVSLRPDGTVNRRLYNLMDLKVGPSTAKPVGGVSVTTTDITIDSSRNIWFRLFTPTSTTSTTTNSGNEEDDDVASSSLPVIFYFHGGGFAFCSPDTKTFDDLCRKLATEIPAIVVSVNYRLSPEHRFPCHYDDGIHALKSIDQPEFSRKLPASADLKRCFVAGDSAGGNLAHHVALRAGEYEFLQVKLIGLIAIQPFFGGEERTESEKRLAGGPVLSLEMTDRLWKSFLPDDGSDRDHPAVNVFGPRSVDISGAKNFPSTLVIVGGFDLLQDRQRQYYEGLKRSGKEVKLIEYPKAVHGFYTLPDQFPETAMLFTSMKDFVQEHATV